MGRFTLPRDLYHGKGSLAELKNLQGKRAIVVVGGGSMKRFGFLDKAVGYLKEAGMEVELFENVEPDPSVETVMKGAEAMRKFQPDWIISMGGGSPIDASNSISVLCANPDMRVIDLFTNFKNIPHGKANGLLMKEYIVYNYPVVKEKIDTAMKLLQCESIDDFLDKLEKLIGVAPSLTDEEVERYTELTMLQKGSIANTPNPLNEEKIHQFWKRMQ